MVKMSTAQLGTARNARGLVAVLLVGSYLVVGCNDHPPKPEPVEYVMYYGNSAGGDLYVFDTDSLTIIDSIPGVGPPYSMTVSPDGEWIYTVPWIRPGQSFLKKIAARTKVVVDSVGDDKFSKLTQLDRGQILLRGLDRCRNEIIDPNSLVVTGTVDDSICPIRGPACGTRVVALIGDGNRLCSYDVVSRAIEGSYTAHLLAGTTFEVIDAALHQDGTRVLVLGWESDNHAWFVIGDLATGETLLQYPLAYPQGQIAINESGTIAAVTDPSRAGTMDTPPTLDLFDLGSLQHLKRFAGEPGGELEGNLASVQFLPGSNLVYAVTGLTTADAIIQVFDSQTMDVVRSVHNPFPGGATTEFILAVKPQ